MSVYIYMRYSVKLTLSACV